jgi:hypothetical protein
MGLETDVVEKALGLLRIEVVMVEVEYDNSIGGLSTR